MYTGITTSLFDFLKAGPGPSSSHTIGPMRMGKHFAGACAALDPLLLGKAARVRARLFGSLSATGSGHGTEAALVAGLCGYEPQDCPADLLQKISLNPHTKQPFLLGGKPFAMAAAEVEHDLLVHKYPYSNTLLLDLLSEAGHVLYGQEYYSVGGGFIQWKGWQPEERGKPVHVYGSMQECKRIMHESGLSIHDILLDNECAITGLQRPQVLEKLDAIIALMEAGLERGLKGTGLLPGSLNVPRKAAMIRAHAENMPLRGDRFLCGLNAYAYATSEENACGGVVVTAPTCGGSGVVPAMLYAMRHDLTIGDRALREGLLAAALVGFLAKHNAAIAGAEVGCQGEVGVASAMAAAMLAHGRGAAVQIVENAAEIALEHHLGLSCDPVAGLVQIPCIERNAMGVAKAYNAAMLASAIKPEMQRVSLDAVISAMAETGREMHSKFKETSLGGLAVSMVNC